MSSTSNGRNQLSDYAFDAAYLARLRARDAGTLAHFYDFFYLPVRNKIRHKCRWEDADDLVQNVFVAALTRIDSGEPEDPAKLPRYILGIVRNLLLEHWRGPGKDAVDLDAVVLTDGTEGADAQLDEALQSSRLREMVRKLPPKYRDVMERVFFQEQSRADVASETGLSLANLRLLICRGVKRLRKEWHNPGWEPTYGRSIRQSKQRSQKRHLRKLNPDVT